MLYAPEIEPVASGICLWRFYDPSLKTDLFSTALEAAGGTYLIDPIPLAPDAISTLTSRAKINAIIITNENHERAAADFARKFNIPIYLDAAIARSTALPGAMPIQENSFPAQLTPVGIEGGPAGETAVHFAGNDGTIVIGDALINFQPYGFAPLPAKYCSNFKRMRRSLAKLMDYSFERMFFAHGMPILAHGRARLELLLKEKRNS
jgi:hypothetical protein